MWFVYLIQHSETRETYLGVSGDLRRRVREHTAGTNRSTRRTSGRWQIAYCEGYRSRADALVRERRLKQHGRAKQELLKRAANSLI